VCVCVCVLTSDGSKLRTNFIVPGGRETVILWTKKHAEYYTTGVCVRIYIYVMYGRPLSPTFVSAAKVPFPAANKSER